MRRTHLIAAIACLVTIAGVSQDAFARGRMYHPGLGRYMQRDPLGTANEPPMARNLSASQFTQRDPTGSNQYADGMTLYQYVGSNPANRVDPSGLKWTITRKANEATALATPEIGDTFGDLAREVSLDERELLKWMTWSCKGYPSFIVSESGYAGVRVNKSIKDCCEFRVPNTLVLMRGGVSWHEFALHSKIQGWMIHMSPPKGWHGYHSEAIVEVRSGADMKRALDNRKDLVGFYYGGHGSGFGILNPGNTDTDMGGLLSPGDLDLNHKVSAIYLLACYSAEQWPNGWERLVAPRGQFRGFEGTVSALTRKWGFFYTGR